jgi:rubrerythrin
MQLDQFGASTDAIRSSPLRAMTCSTCGYGVSRATEPGRCPMCGGSDWEHEQWRPFADLVRDLKPSQRPSG